jgi:CheY-like chemotaxis protein
MPTNNPVVLVVEDDPPVRTLIKDVLRDEGYNVITVHDGAAVLAVVRSVKVDLITLDLDLPTVSGNELLQMLEQRRIHIPPVVVVTGNTPVQRQVKRMAEAVIAKPFDIDALVEAVARLVPPQLESDTGISERAVGGGSDEERGADQV